MATVLAASAPRAQALAPGSPSGPVPPMAAGTAGALRRIARPTYGWNDLRERFRQGGRTGRDDRIVLYRHGATNYNDRKLVSGQHDTALSDEGRRQAEALQTTIPPHLDLIACSGLSRAVETMLLAIPPSKRSGTPIYADARLNEVHLGDLQGRRRRHLPEFETGDLDFAPPNGETYREAAERVYSAISDIFDALSRGGPIPGTAAVFCHAGVLRIVSALTSGSKDPKDVFRTTVGNAERLEIGSASARVADYWGSASLG